MGDHGGHFDYWGHHFDHWGLHGQSWDPLYGGWLAVSPAVLAGAKAVGIWGDMQREKMRVQAEDKELEEAANLFVEGSTSPESSTGFIQRRGRRGLGCSSRSRSD